MAQQKAKKRSVETTALFVKYSVELVIRLCLLVAAVVLYVVDSELLDVQHPFQQPLRHIFAYVFFILFAVDFTTKFSSRSKIAVGSLKQYKFYHIPTQSTTGKSHEEWHEYIRQLALSGRERRAGHHMHPLRSARAKLAEARIMLRRGTADAIAGARRTLRDVDVLRLLPFEDTDLDIAQEIRSQFRFRRLSEIAGVILFWIFFNTTVGLLLYTFDLLNAGTCIIWSCFYFAFDMICVVLWCPLQLLFMKNRCCTTCQIFNWDGIMAITPMIFVPCWYSWILIAAALVILLRWEITAFTYPERFFEETNGSLSCANCRDKLCKLRPPILEPLSPTSKKSLGHSDYRH